MVRSKYASDTSAQRCCVEAPNCHLTCPSPGQVFWCPNCRSECPNFGLPIQAISRADQRRGRLREWQSRVAPKVERDYKFANMIATTVVRSILTTALSKASRLDV